MHQIIIHIDMDAFYASVEMRDNPLLRGKPLIIGSLPNERGVVATCSYEARKYGIHSAMNIKEAYKLCPNGIYMHPDFDKYRSVSNQLHEIWDYYASASEYIALDEAYLDVTEKAKDFEGARKIARTIKQRTREELNLSCSVGIGYSKAAAKTASEEKKPDGFFEILTPEDFVNLIIDRDVRALYTVGAKTAEKLNEIGIFTVRDVTRRSDEIISKLGKHGQWITALSRGEDNRKVTPYRAEDAKSIGREITFQEDVSDFAFLDDVIFLLSLSVARRADRVGLFGKGVSVKLTYSNMKTITRSHAVDNSESVGVIYSESAKLLAQAEKAPVRLIGVSIYNLSEERDGQIRFEDLYNNDSAADSLINNKLASLNNKYHLDFSGHIDQIFHGLTLHKTIEYMRKHRPRENREMFFRKE